MKEAETIKEVFSSNKIANVKIPELDGQNDLTLKLEREEFEARMGPFF